MTPKQLQADEIWVLEEKAANMAGLATARLSPPALLATPEADVTTVVVVVELRKVSWVTV